MDVAALIDIAIGAATLLGSLLTGAAAVWLFARRRLADWWRPYRTGIKAMAQLPAMRAGIDGCRRDLIDVRESLGMLTLQVRARGDINTDAAEFETDTAGANTAVNQTYARWLSVGKAELLGWGWVNFVHRDDRARVRSEWEQCRAEHRVFSARYRIVDSDGAVIDVATTITPIPDAPPAQQWIGVMRRVEG